MPSPGPKLSVIVPVYNEKRTIDILLEKVRSVAIEKEIIVVDGDSTDGTREKLAQEEKKPDTTVIYQPRRMGRGNAVKTGLQAAHGEFVIFQDADLELDPSDYPALLKPLEEGDCDVVFGSRFLQGKPQMRFLQYWGNRIINVLVRILFRAQLSDVETCYQVFRRASLADIEVRNNDFAFTVELTIRLVQKDYKIKEIPITYIPRGRLEGKKIYWKDGFVSLWTIFRCRFLEGNPYGGRGGAQAR